MSVTQVSSVGSDQYRNLSLNFLTLKIHFINTVMSPHRPITEVSMNSLSHWRPFLRSIESPHLPRTKVYPWILWYRRTFLISIGKHLVCPILKSITELPVTQNAFSKRHYLTSSAISEVYHRILRLTEGFFLGHIESPHLPITESDGEVLVSIVECRPRHLSSIPGSVREDGAPAVPVPAYR